jgi:hypothetical protein
MHGCENKGGERTSKLEVAYITKEWGTHVEAKEQLQAWREDVEKCGMRYDKMETVNKWTFSYCDDPRKSDMLIITRTIQQRALTAALQVLSPDFQFIAS